MHLREASLPPSKSRCFPKLGREFVGVPSGLGGHMCVCVHPRGNLPVNLSGWRTALFPFIIEVRSWTLLTISVKHLEFSGRNTSLSACQPGYKQSLAKMAFHSWTLEVWRDLQAEWTVSMASYSKYAAESGRN